MNPLTFFALSLVVFAAAEFLILPRLNRRVQADRTPGSIRHHLARAVVGWLRSSAIVLGISSLAIAAFVFLVGWFGLGNTAADLGNALTRVQRWQEFFSSIGAGLGWVTLLSLVAGMALLSRHRVKKRVADALRRGVQAELARLAKDRERGQWPEIPPTEEMKKAEEQFAKATYLLEHPELITETEPQKLPAIKEALEQHRRQAHERYHQLDLLRRFSVKIEDDVAAVRPAKTRWEKFQRFWFSEGLVDVLSGTMGVVSLLSLLLLVPALISVTSDDTAARLDERRIELHDLRIARTQEEARREWASAGLSGADASPLSEEDEEAIAQAAVQFETSATRLPGAPQAVSSATRAVLRQAWVRRNILEADAARRTKSVRTRMPGMDAAETAMMAEAAKPLPDGPVTKAGRDVQAELRAAAARDTNFRGQLRAQAARFQKPASESKLLTAMMDGLVSAVGPEGAPDAKPFVDAVSDMRQRQKEIFLGSLKKHADLARAAEQIDGRRLQELLPTDVYERAGRRLETMAQSSGPDLIAQRLREAPPSLSARVSSTVNERLVSAIERASSDAGMGRARLPSADIAATFDDFFPAHLGDESRSGRTALQQQLARRAGVTLPASPTRVTGPAAQSSFVRSRSFARLRGFSRVGGVLIGRTDHADMDTAYDFVDLRWDRVGSREYVLALLARDGTVLKTKPQPAALLHQALVYAADGRSVAVTMVTAEPLPGLKILAHPAVVDTPLGYRLIEVDRFVDTHTRATPSVQAAERAVQGWDLLYRLAWAARYIAIYDRTSGLTREQRGASPDVRLAAGRILARPDFREAAGAHLRGAAASVALLQSRGTRDAVYRTLANQSPIFSKFEFYERELVDAMLDHLAPDLDEFLAAIAAHRDFDVAIALATTPPAYQVWSGVRERSGSILDLFTNLAEPAVSFILQTSFTSTPQFGPHAGDENYDDPSPWEYPAIADRIDRTTITAARNRPKDAAILADVNQFVLVQRLLRAALDGRLGADFPLEKLGVFAEALLPEASAALVTPKWNVRPFDPRNNGALQDLYRELGIEDDQQRARELAMGPLPAL